MSFFGYHVDIKYWNFDKLNTGTHNEGYKSLHTKYVKTFINPGEFLVINLV